MFAHIYSLPKQQKRKHVGMTATCVYLNFKTVPTLKILIFLFLLIHHFRFKGNKQVGILLRIKIFIANQKLNRQTSTDRKYFVYEEMDKKTNSDSFNV